MNRIWQTFTTISKQYAFERKFYRMLCLFTLVGIVLSIHFPVVGQEGAGWTDPLNLSRSGSATNPHIVVDAEGSIHVVWEDIFAGWVYTVFAGEQWSTPVVVKFPFANDGLTFASDGQGRIHAIWLDNERRIMHSRATSSRFGEAVAWTAPLVIASSALTMEVVSDERGDIHLAYIRPVETVENPAGVYHRQTANSGDAWLPPQSVYQSPYFRGLDPDSASVDIDSALVDEEQVVYLSWDNRFLKRVFITKSVDGGTNWSDVWEVVGPESVQGLGAPMNIQISSNDDRILLLYQVGVAGSQCTQYSQWSVDGGSLWTAPVKILVDYSVCPSSSEIIQESEGHFVALFSILEDLVFLAWDGIEWSKPQNPVQLSAFQNPDTYDAVIFRCRQVVTHGDTLLVVGCDQGVGSDIWFTSAPLGSIQDWFDEPVGWSSFATVISSDGNIPTFYTLVDQENNNHIFWVERIISEVDDRIAIQHARWNGESWSVPNTIESRLNGEPRKLSAVNDGNGRILLTWVDGEAGRLFFSWASADRATISAEWAPGESLSASFAAVSSPDILVDASGKIGIAFAVPFNENRGIYFINSEDQGMTWSNPIRIFDAESTNWDLIDDPEINLGGDGRLHLLFTRYSAQREPIGLFYTQSHDGGITWNPIEEVSAHPVMWSEVVCYDSQVVHRVWQEKRALLLVNYHQASTDGGQTWGDPVEVSNTRVLNATPALSLDLSGNMHYFQLTNPQNLTLQYLFWNGSRWVNQEAVNLKISSEKSTVNFLHSNITPSGYLRAYLSVNSPDQYGEMEHKLIVASHRLEKTFETSQTVVGVIPEPVDNRVETQDTNLQASPTVESPLGSLSDPAPPTNRTIVGLLLVGIIFITSLGVGIYVIHRSRHKAPLDG